MTVDRSRNRLSKKDLRRIRIHLEEMADIHESLLDGLRHGANGPFCYLKGPSFDAECIEWADYAKREIDELNVKIGRVLRRQSDSAFLRSKLLTDGGREGEPKNHGNGNGNGRG